MNTKFLIAGAAVVASLAACANSRRAAGESGNNSSTAAQTDSRTDTNPIRGLSMRRSGCYGRCPIYEVRVTSNGVVRYTGERFTDKLGVYEKNVGTARAQALLRFADSLRVDTAAAEYEMMVADLPGVRFTFVRADASVQAVNNAHFGPRYFVRIANEVDSLAQVDFTWKKVADAAPERN